MSVHIQLASLASTDFLFPFVSSFPSSSSSCFTNPRHSAKPLVQKTQKLKSSHFPIFSAHQDTNPTTIPATTTASTSTRKQHVATYLTERLGFSEELSLTISKKLIRHREYNRRANQVTDLISIENADNVITHLQEFCGLDLSQVKKVLTKHPRVLVSDVDKTLRPKVKLVQDLGFSTSELALVLSRKPFLYLACDLGPAIHAQRGFMGSDEDVVKVLKGLRRGSAPAINKHLIPNVTVLENEYGIPRDKLIKFLTKSPQSLMRNTESLRDVLVRVEDKWGITRDSAVFLTAFRVFSGISDEKINSKCQVFRSYGWSDSHILSLIRRSPTSLGHSEAGIKNKLDFLVNELGYEPSYLASQHILFGCSLENRVVPRHKILKILKENELIKADYKLDNAVRLTDNQFFDRFIRPFKNEVPELRQVYINGAGGVPTEKLKLL